nr:MAG TPA: hypothetical protein [Caudoviricetes sp.]
MISVYYNKTSKIKKISEISLQRKIGDLKKLKDLSDFRESDV